MTSTGRGRLLAAGGAVALASLAAACGGTSGSGTQSASPVPSVPPAASGQATGTGDVQRFQQVATGPLARAVQADAEKLARDAANTAAAEADARKLASDLAAWSSALRSAPVPASVQATKDKLLQGLDRMHKGVSEFADGLRSHDGTLVSQGQADIQAGVAIISQAATAAP